MEYAKNLTTKYDVDVLIAGGGPAGIAAGIAAARDNKSVLLIEQYGCLGGMGTTGMVPEFMCFDDGINLLAGGIGGEVKKALFGDEIAYKCYNASVEKVKSLYDRMVIESGVKLLLFTKIVDVVVKDKKIEYAIVSSRSGMYAIKAKAFIDCTGDGDLSVLAGASYEFGDEDGTTMPATLCSFWSGIDFEKRTQPDGFKVGDAYLNGVLSQLDLCLPGIKMVDERSGVGGGNVGHTYSVNDLDEEALTAAMLKSREIVSEYVRYYREYVPGCENANLCFTAPILGVRESRRIVCDYMMNHMDYVNRAVFEDEIGRYNYPVDIHPKSPDVESIEQFAKDTALKYQNGESYGISLTILVKDFTHKFF
ncbi:MAG: FAD-dependent oxidoreductase [Clostridiales bacterium]|nr:FAD-dependent oxidoreductase [Clostridiales bacterium]